MKFFTYVILPEKTEITDNKAIEKWVDILLSPHLESFRGEWMNRGWDDGGYWSPGKLDYYSILTREDHIKYYEGDKSVKDTYYAVYPVEKMIAEEIIPFAILTPCSFFRTDSYPLEEDNPNWPTEALTLYNFFKGFNGVFLYCHS